MAARLSSLATAVLLGILVGGAIDARSMAAAQSPDTMTALLEEVRGLRAAMEQLASAGPRTQLLFGRLQIQEQRVNAMGRRLEGVRERLRVLGRDQEELQTRLPEIERALSSAQTLPGRQELEAHLAGLKREMGRLTREMQALQGEEAAILGEIATEQGRWSEINRSLDELERSLVRR